MGEECEECVGECVEGGIDNLGEAWGEDGCTGLLLCVVTELLRRAWLAARGEIERGDGEEGG